MSYEIPKQPYQQISPTFTPGYHYPASYHNMGQRMTPYLKKYFGQSGDYGPVQKSAEYGTVWNNNYPYPLDAITAPCSRTTYNPKYPECPNTCPPPPFFFQERMDGSAPHV